MNETKGNVMFILDKDNPPIDDSSIRDSFMLRDDISELSSEEQGKAWDVHRSKVQEFWDKLHGLECYEISVKSETAK